MLAGTYYESGYEKEIPEHGEISKDDLLTLVAAAEPEVSVEVTHGAYHSIRAELPYKCYASGGVFKTADSHSFFLDNVFVGDRRLIGSGTGSRLIRAVVEKGLEINPEEQWLHTTAIRLGAINALEKLFPGRVRVDFGDDPMYQYGFGTDKTLEQMLRDHAPRPGKTFKAEASVTNIQ